MVNDLVAHPSFWFSIACNEVNSYMVIKYFMNTGDSFIIIFNMAKALINNSYTN